MSDRLIRLDDKYAATEGKVHMTGTQALVRLPMTQIRRDRAAGLNTGAFISGYRGSPLGAYDQQITRAKRHLDAYGVEFQPGVNEELAATAIWGSQQLPLSPGARKDGVVGLWYGKGPGVDRCGDVFKHGNAAGSSAHGGVLCFAGDDHTCKSSTVPHQSDHAFMAAIMPCLYPSSIHEFLEVGLLGIAMSRFSGCWVGMKLIADTVETTSVVDLACEQRKFVIPEDFELPPGGLNLRWPDPPLVQDERLQEYKGYAAIAFGRANRVDEVTLDTPNARFGIIGSGKAYEDVAQALIELGIGPDEAAAIGLRLYKVRMTWPLEPEGVRHFSEGLQEVLVVEERREIVEHQIKQQLFNWRADVRPRIVGKFDEQDRPFLSLAKGLNVSVLARAIATRLLKFDLDPGLRDRITAKLSYLESRMTKAAAHQAPIERTPFFCSGCPHNTSTRVPEGSRALAGIGCHYMAVWMDRSTETFTQMGGEGVPWTAIGKFSDEKHIFANLGDGTYFHSGLLAVRQSVAAKANITYKILYNDAVAMTGGQTHDGELSPQRITHQLHAEGVWPIYLVTDTPDAYSSSDLANGVQIEHRDRLDHVMKLLRETEGCSAIVYVQTCAAEKRRRRKRGLMADPDQRLFIHPAVCEGCGDCSVQSNCLSVEPLETEFGRKRRINQSSCNKDFSCLKGFCPSFITVRGGKIRKQKGAGAGGADISAVPAPPPITPAADRLDKTWNIAVTGVGGAGVLTVGALIAMAAHVEGKNPMVLDMAGLAQKGGAVLSHIRIADSDAPVTASKIAIGGADLLLAADSVVAASKDGVTLCDPNRTQAVVNAKMTPVAAFVRNRDVDFRAAVVERSIRENVATDQHFHDFGAIAVALLGDEIAANMIMLGYATQAGLIPLKPESIEQAIELNGVAIKMNVDAFRWGRVLAHAPEQVRALAQPKDAPRTEADMSLEELITHRAEHLANYQDDALAEKYRALVAKTEQIAREKLSTTAEQNALIRAVARNYAKLLAYKDEYEVARLLSDPSLQKMLSEQFDGDYRLSFNLAPPLLPGLAPDGRPKKREFGPFTLRLFRLLARLKYLRGTKWDLFGRTEERRAERALITQFEQDAADALALLSDRNAGAVIALLSLPDEIRGYGPVKAEAMASAAVKHPQLRAALEPGDTARLAAQAAE